MWLVYLLVIPARLPHFVFLAPTEPLFMLLTALVFRLALLAIITTLTETVRFVFRLAPPAQLLHSASVAP